MSYNNFSNFNNRNNFSRNYNNNYSGHDKLNSAVRRNLDSRNNNDGIQKRNFNNFYNDRQRRHGQQYYNENNEKKVTSTRKKIIFNIPIEGLTGIQMEIEKLEDTEEQDVLAWIKEFNELIEYRKLDESQALMVLHSLLSTELKDKISKKRTVRTALKCLKDEIYNDKKFDFILKN